jgi:hypothetical protein
MMSRIKNIMRGETLRANSILSLPVRATISTYDPDTYSAKVFIQPDGDETGFLPIGSSWVGNLWGMFCPPSQGDEVDVHFQEGGKNAAYISLRFFGNKARPLPVPSGELWFIHSSGSKWKMLNDGTVIVEDSIGSAFTLNGDGTATLSADLTIVGRLIVKDDISDLNGASGTLAEFRDIYDEHTHGGIQGGSGNTAVPNQQD